MGKKTSQAHRQKWYMAFEKVMSKYDDFVSFNKVYSDYYDEMRGMGIKYNIATRQQFAHFTTTNYPLLEKERMTTDKRKEVHYRMVK